jgi:dissimilatory sulfite reductase (desulfoviridin) alpha/beta subunit
MSKLLKVWDADRSKINFAYRQIVEIFKLVINGYHQNANKGYHSEINDLTENIQLKSFKEQVNHFMKSKEDFKDEVSNLRNELRRQKELLQTWWQSESSKELLSFPK